MQSEWQVDDFESAIVRSRVDRGISLKWVKVESGHYHLPEVSVKILPNLHCYVNKVIKKFFTFVWEGFNWMAGRGTNHRVNCFKKNSGIMTLLGNSEK